MAISYLPPAVIAFVRSGSGGWPYGQGGLKGQSTLGSNAEDHTEEYATAWGYVSKLKLLGGSGLGQSSGGDFEQWWRQEWVKHRWWRIRRPIEMVSPAWYFSTGGGIGLRILGLAGNGLGWRWGNGGNVAMLKNIKYCLHLRQRDRHDF